MYAIFYDLETTDRNCIGQILNYSFILVDDELKPIDEISGLVRISRLQLPEPGAILANRTDVLEHQRVAQDNERLAMQKISDFIWSCIRRAKGAVAFAGYNSSRFDLQYLRTSLIRNGFNPYFDNKLSARDLLHVVQKAYLTSEELRSKVREVRKGEKKLSLSLETVTRALELLDGVQAHESRADVLLTIRLAGWLKEKTGLDVATYEAYEGLRLHTTAGSGAVYFAEEAQYDMSEPNFAARTPYTVLAADHKRALWINLDRYAVQQDPRAISWRSAQKSAFFVSPQASADRELQALARAAIKQFHGITLSNFFKKSTCDVEQDIYRLDFNSLDLFCQAVQQNKRELLSALKAPEAKVLFTRYRLAAPELNLGDPSTREVFKRYAMYRYGGELQLARSVEDNHDGIGTHHSRLSDMVKALDQARDAALAQNEAADIKLLNSLESFYRASEVVQVAGAELVPAWRRSAA
jgi:hypothetical protein